MFVISQVLFMKKSFEFLFLFDNYSKKIMRGNSMITKLNKVIALMLKKLFLKNCR